jgi:EAL domain-containing protein (putative c-di-GMP-specific phosphodiesterase class I)
MKLSPVLFREPDFLERLLEHTRFFDTGLEQVHFEVTETGIMDQPNRASNTLNQIRERGSRVAVDDFGTGHSSLAYLADLPVDEIKIDKLFVQNIDRPWGEAIVGAAAALAGKLGMTTVAEGIETREQYDSCRDLGVTVGQGFLMARPMFHQQFQQWLEH